jgi:hypothetical protein
MRMLKPTANSGKSDVSHEVWRSRRMRPWLSTLVSAGITFAAAEVISRRLLHLSDQAVPLVVIPASVVVSVLTMKYLIARRARSERKEP